MSVIYLAGPIFGCTYTDMHAWRDDMTKRLRQQHTVIDPSHRLRLDQEPGAVVEEDKAEISAADTLIAYCPRPTVGTSMEILYAWERGKHVIIYTPPHTAVSPWLHYHSHQILHHPVDVAAATITYGAPGPFTCHACGYEIAAVGASWCHTDQRSYNHEIPRHQPTPAVNRDVSGA